MSGPFYQFWTYDQNQHNWFTRVDAKDGGGHGALFLFLHAFCPACWNFDQDTVFDKGFEDVRARIRVRKGRNILRTDDGFLCVSTDLLKALKSAGVRGFESKPLFTGMYWHVLRITNRRRFDPKIYQSDEKPCPTCGRFGQYGSVQYEREIDLPPEELTFFSTDKERGQGGYDIFVTDKLREVLQQSDAKGGELHKLWSAEEEKRRKDNPKWKRKDGLVILGQHRETVNVYD